MTRIILVRHGQTQLNLGDRVRGQVDVPLDPLGMQQAEAAAEAIATTWRPVAVYCSPLLRTVQTAEVIARRVGLEAQPHQGLLDIHFGEWQGLELSVVRERWPEIMRQWIEEPAKVQFPGGENFQVVRERGMAAIREFIDRYPDDDVVAVAHNVVNRVLLCAMLGLDNSHYWNIEQGPTAINVIEWRKNMFIIYEINNTCHLRTLPAQPPPDLLKTVSGAGQDHAAQERAGCEVTIYTDGACEPNPGPGGWAALLQFPDHEQELTGSELQTTNNRMELQAAIAALEALPERCHVHLYTDSRYLQQGITSWLRQWLRQGWRKADRSPVQNADLWQKLHALTQKHDVHWDWVRGHAGHPQNERVNSLANAAIPRRGGGR